MRRADAKLDHFQSALDIALRVGDRFSMFAGQQLGQRIHFPVRQVEEPHEDAGASLRIRFGPSGLSGGGVLDRGADLAARRECHSGTHLAGHWLVTVGEARRLANDALAGDKMAIGDHVTTSRTSWFLIGQKGNDVPGGGR
jgi:hypothetical protein